MVIPGIIVFITVVLFAIPRIARLYIVKDSNKFIGRDLTIDKIRINYFKINIYNKETYLFRSA